MKRITLVLVVISILSSMIYADSYLGTQGLLSIPTANVRKTGSASFGLSFTQSDLYTNFKVAFVENLELGIGVSNSKPIYGFFKWRLLEETRDTPAFAIGSTGSDFYAVVSKNLMPNGLKAHMGIGSGLYHGVFGGISYVINPVSVSATRIPVPITTLLVELKESASNEDAPCVFNIGGRFQFNDYLSVDIGLLNMRSFTFGAYLTTAF
ncbi:MAG: YjbH domain-containing protein [Firmicutes bacterium]|nr:YjbH domain-containing protein [Bacillota bacterium]MDD4693151.1 YjbH domain-containing protein [Bacillota bacterium]